MDEDEEDVLFEDGFEGEGEGEEIGDPEFHIIEENYKIILQELKSSEALLVYADEFTKLFDAAFGFRMAEKAADERARELGRSLKEALNKLDEANDQAQTDLATIETQNKDIEFMKRMTDCAHAREQATQEVVTNLRLQVNRLQDDLKQFSNMGSEQVEEMSREKQREALIRERERLSAEVVELKRRMDANRTYQEELERKNSEADLRASGLEQQIENQNSDAVKAQRAKDRLLAQIDTLNEEAAAREEEVNNLQEQIRHMNTKLNKLEHQITNMRASNEKLSQEHITMTANFYKASNELDEAQSALNKTTKEMATAMLECKIKDDENIRLRQDAAKTAKMRESYVKKLQMAENAKTGLEKEKENTKSLLNTMTRDIENMHKVVEQEKRAAETAIRDRDMTRNEILKLQAKIHEQQASFSAQEIVKRQLEMDMQIKAQELNKQKSLTYKADRERDRAAQEAKEFSEKWADAVDEVKMKQAEIQDYKKSLVEADLKLQHVQQMFETVRSERNVLQRNFQASTEEATDLRERVKVSIHQVDQLKEDVSNKEAAQIRAENLLTKCEKDKQQLRMELMQSALALQHCRSEIKEMKNEEKALRQEIADAEFLKVKLQKELDKLLNERDIIGTQLVRRNDELALLYDKINILQTSLSRGETQYSQRLDDIRLLKLEIKRLRQEKYLLSKNITNMTDLKQEVLHLERDLTKERLKVTALEEEVQTPMNLHRWRRLRGSDPERMELIEKIQILQKKILAQGQESEERKSDLKEAEMLYLNLRNMLAKQPGPDVQERLSKTQRSLTLRGSQMKALCAELNAYEDQNRGYSAREQELLDQLKEIRKLYLEQKKINDKAKEKAAEERGVSGAPSHCNCTILPRVSSSKTMGGGFKMAT